MGNHEGSSQNDERFPVTTPGLCSGRIPESFCGEVGVQLADLRNLGQLQTRSLLVSWISRRFLHSSGFRENHGLSTMGILLTSTLLNQFFGTPEAFVKSSGVWWNAATGSSSARASPSPSGYKRPPIAEPTGAKWPHPWWKMQKHIGQPMESMEMGVWQF